MEIRGNVFAGKLIRAQFSGGVLHLSEPLDIPDGTEIVIDIIRGEKSIEERLGDLKKSAGAGKDPINAEELKPNTCSERLGGLCGDDERR